MSHYKRTHGIEIDLNVTDIDEGDVSLGLYLEAGNSYLRWSEYPVVGTVKTWTSGIISKGGLGVERQSADLRRCGMPASYDGYNIVIQDTNQNYLKLKDLGINLIGRTIKRYEFVGTDVDSDSVEQKLLSTMIVQDSTWNERQWTIQVRNATYTQNAFMGTVINNDPTTGNYVSATDDMNGKIVPLTFGIFQNIDGSPYPAKFIRTAGLQREIYNNGLKPTTGKYFTPENQAVFPVMANFAGVTSTGSHNITEVGCASYLTIGDHINAHSGFNTGADMVVTGVSGTTVTVDGVAIASVFTFIDFLHKNNETESPAPCYVINLGLDRNGSASLPPVANDMQGFMEDLRNKWVQVVEGGSTSGSLVGKYSKIENFQLLDFSYGQIGVTIALSQVFSKNLTFNSTLDITNQAWVSFFDIPFIFSGDVWPMGGFLDSAGNLSSEALNLYTYKKDSSFLERKSYEVGDDNKLIITSSLADVGFCKIASYGYTGVPSANKNSLFIDVSLFDNDPSQLTSFDIFNLINLSKYIASNLSAYGLATYLPLSSSNIYLFSDFLSGSSINTNTDISGNNWCDRDDSSTLALSIVLQRTPSYGQIHDFYVAYECDIDIAKILIEYDSYYLGINCKTQAGQAGETNYTNSNTYLLWRRYIGSNHEILLKTNGEKYLDRYDSASVYGGIIDTLPDFYYNVRTLPDKNENFSYEKTINSPDRKLSGYEIFQFSGITSVAQLKSVYKIGLIFGTVSGGYNTVHKSISINEIALICKMSASISTELYSLCNGRTFNSTWGNRKTATDPITTPSEVIEHCKRLGNWGTGTVEPGKAYDTASQIKLSGEGSFDSISLLPSTTTWTNGNFRPTFQVEDDSQAWTGEIEKEVCQEFNLCTYSG